MPFSDIVSIPPSILSARPIPGKSTLYWTNIMDSEKKKKTKKHGAMGVLETNFERVISLKPGQTRFFQHKLSYEFQFLAG